MSDSQLAASVLALLDGTADTFLVCAGAGAVVSQKTAAQAKTLLALVKADVGLGNVDNTADTAKPVSTAQQTAIDAKIGGTLGATTNRLAKSSGTGGLTLQSTGITIDASNNVSGVAEVTAGGTAGSGPSASTEYIVKNSSNAGIGSASGGHGAGALMLMASGTIIASLVNSTSRGFMVRSDMPIGFCTNTSPSGFDPDACFRRNAAGVIAIDNGTAGTFRDLIVRNLRMSAPTLVPASASASGSEGQIAWDASYIYVCTATNTWKRVAIATW